MSEPRLLRTPAASRHALELIDRIMGSLAKAKPSDRASEEFRVLRQALGYCCSVVVAANPRDGKPMLGRWARSADPDIRWIVKENLKKTRLTKMDPVWAARLAR